MSSRLLLNRLKRAESGEVRTQLIIAKTFRVDSYTGIGIQERMQSGSDGVCAFYRNVDCLDCSWFERLQ